MTTSAPAPTRTRTSVSGAVLAGLVAAAVTLGGATFAQPQEAPAGHTVPAATPQVSPDHPALTTVWRPR